MHFCPDCLRACFCEGGDVHEDDCSHFTEDECKGVQGRSDSELRIIGSRDYDDQEYELGEAGA